MRYRGYACTGGGVFFVRASQKRAQTSFWCQNHQRRHLNSSELCLWSYTSSHFTSGAQSSAPAADFWDRFNRSGAKHSVSHSVGRFEPVAKNVNILPRGGGCVEGEYSEQSGSPCIVTCFMPTHRPWRLWRLRRLWRLWRAGIRYRPNEPIIQLIWLKNDSLQC